ncbi:hypothetical protein BT69DRAFT_566421 [Atractiella rhizophila]|nr:hypothetical protein BT69DRAFT_566421 [Atractiella rhizophila]
MELKTFGSKVHTLILPETDYAHTHLRPLLKHMPNLHTLQFSRYSPVASSSSTKSFPYYLTPSLRRIVEYNVSPHASNDSRVETLIDCFNKAPNVEHLSVAGITLSTVQSQRLLFVWRINKNLIHAASGAEGRGLKEIYLGNNCNVGLGFLRGLSESCSSLTSLHIDAGCTVSTDSTNGTTSHALDIKDFVRTWGATLTSLTLVGCSDMPTTGGNYPFDEVLTVCPHLQTLHLRSDHISFDFFRSILSLHNPPHDPFSSSSEGGAGGEVTEKPKSRLHLCYLRITHTIPSPGTLIASKDSIVLPNKQAVLLFARTALELEARGISWPSGFDEGGRTSQKDMLNRATWLMEGVARKRGIDIGKGKRDEEESESDEE